MWKWKCPKCNEINEEISNGHWADGYLCKNCIKVIPQNEIVYPETDEEEDDIDVELISAGYDWECPNCGMWNYTEEHVDHVQCMRCQKEFDVSGVTNP
jgi:DNA-directed RNA polymerase subunit RPC12/RpoP